MKPVPGQNFRYLGAFFDLAGWHEAGAGVERFSPPLTAVGYGEPAFAGFYPSSATSFGFLDTLTDLAGYQPATSTVSYHVAGWYGNGTSDPLRGGDVTPGSNRYGWTWTGATPPTATVCSGVVHDIGWDPATAYLDDPPRPLTVAVADTAAEALSALLASAAGPSLGVAEDIERLLNALQFGLLSKSAQVDSQPTFDEAMHRAGFGALTGGSVWSVVTGSDPSSTEGGEVTLPDALAGQLNALNVLQLRADALARDVQARRQQLFADWYKYLLILYTPDHVPAELRDAVSAVAGLLDQQAQAIGAIVNPGGTLDTLEGQITAAAEAIPGALPPGALTLRSDAAAPPYYQPAEPVLVLSGSDVTPAMRHRATRRGPASGLECRLDDQIVSGVTLAQGLVPGSTQHAVSAGALPGLSMLPDAAPGVVLQALMREAILLAPSLQLAVAAACAAQGGAGNPAVLGFAATVAALQLASAQYLQGETPAGVSYLGTAPDPVLVHTWAKTPPPWLPLLLQYEVEFSPLHYVGPAGGVYPPGFVSSSFQLPPGGADLQYASGTPQGQQFYTGSTLLTGGAVADMAGEIQRFFDNTGNTDPELARVLAQLQNLPLLAQRLTGASAAMLMRELVLQLPVSDPLATPPQVRFNAEIATAVAEENSAAPLPQASFNPLRTGSLAVSRLRLIDVFGRVKDYTPATPVLSSALRPPAALGLPAGTAFLPPRLTQPARLLFRWLAASDDDVETNSHPATTPVFGWLVPNWLDRALAIYNAAGTALGELTLSIGDTSVLWTPAPGGPFPPAASIETVFAGQHQHLRDFAVAAYANGNPAFLAPFFATLQHSLDFTLPAEFRENAETAVLAGQPLALARAGLTLEVPGGTAASQSWDSFAARVLPVTDITIPPDAGLSKVVFPVRLGGPQRLDDSLIGFWVQRDGVTSWPDFHLPADDQGTVTLTPRASGDVDVVVTLLLDPRGSVHATSGVLPAAEITIPPDHYAASIALLSLALATRPVLSASNTTAMALALPKLTSGTWSWITVGGGLPQWQAAATADAPSAAALDYTPQRISEGWLVIRPDPGRSSAHD